MTGWIAFLMFSASLPALGIAAILWGYDSRECGEDWFSRHPSPAGARESGGRNRPPGGSREHVNQVAGDVKVSIVDVSSEKERSNGHDRKGLAWDHSRVGS